MQFLLGMLSILLVNIAIHFFNILFSLIKINFLQKIEVWK